KREQDSNLRPCCCSTVKLSRCHREKDSNLQNTTLCGDIRTIATKAYRSLLRLHCHADLPVGRFQNMDLVCSQQAQIVLPLSKLLPFSKKSKEYFKELLVFKHLFSKPDHSNPAFFLFLLMLICDLGNGHWFFNDCIKAKVLAQPLRFCHA